MNKRYRYIALFSALGVIIASIVMWKIQQTPDIFVRGSISINTNGCMTSSSNEIALEVIKGYFSMRCGSFAKAAHIRDDASSADKSLSITEPVRKNEKSRVQKLRRLMENWNCRYSGASADLRIDGWKKDGDTIVCSLYEFVWFKNWYRGHTIPASADLSGYGVKHVLRLKQENENFILLSDDYDEDQPTFAVSAGCYQNADYVEYAGNPSKAEPISRKKAPAFSINTAAFITEYHPRKTIAYADRWTMEYNLNIYPNLEPIGGDCCNFASQSLHAGGLPLTSSWTHHGLETGSAAWISSSKLYAELTGVNGNTAIGRGVAVLRMDDKAGRYIRFGGKRMNASAVIFPGCPVFYRWNGGFAADKRWNHTAVCVGTMGDGTPAISCHTSDKFHIKWNYGGENCDYGTVQLTPTSMY